MKPDKLETLRRNAQRRAVERMYFDMGVHPVASLAAVQPSNRNRRYQVAAC
jgi:hypothetical protein